MEPAPPTISLIAPRAPGGPAAPPPGSAFPGPGWENAIAAVDAEWRGLGRADWRQVRVEAAVVALRAGEAGVEAGPAAAGEAPWPLAAVEGADGLSDVASALVAQLSVRLGRRVGAWLCPPGEPPRRIGGEGAAPDAVGPVFTESAATLPFPGGALCVEAPPGVPAAGWELARRVAAEVGRAARVAGRLARAEAAAAQLDLVLQLTHDGIVGGTSDSDLVLWSPAITRITGWTVADVRARGWAPLVYPDPVVRARRQESIRANFQGEQSMDHPVFLTGSDGQEHACVVRTGVTRDAEGRPVVVGVFKDVSAEQDAERERRRQESLDTLGRLASTVAHDFRNIMTAVLGHAELLELSADDPAAVRARVRSVRQAAERGAEVAARLLVFGGARRARPAPLDLAGEVDAAADLARARAPQVEVRVEHEGGAAESVLVDRASCRSALDNLLANATEAAGAGGVVVVRVGRHPAPPSPCFAGLRPDATAVRVRVEDSGRGFSDDARRRLFEPFFSQRAGGHGLGLAAVRSFAEAGAWTVDVPRGSPGGIVDLFLPATALPVAGRVAAPRALPRGDERVWLLEDDPDIAELVCQTLQGLGHEVRAFTTVAAACAAVEGADSPEAQPDVVVLDRQLPDGDGAEVHRALRRRGLRTPVLYCSGLAEPPPPEDRRSSFIEKPYSLPDFVDALRALVGRTVLLPVRSRGDEPPGGG